MKKVISVVLVLTLMFSTVTYAAETSERAKEIKSRGVLVFEDTSNDAVIDSSDLVYLANQIDTLEEYYKQYAEDQYEQGKTDAAYNIYENVQTSNQLNDLHSGLTLFHNSDYLWKSESSKDEKTYVIPIHNSNGGILYGISFDWEYYAHTAYSGNSADCSCTYQLRTSDGTVITQGSYSLDSSQDGSFTTKTKSIYIDMFKYSFSTNSDDLYLYMYVYSHCRVGNIASGGLSQAVSRFARINVNYK